MISKNRLVTLLMAAGAAFSFALAGFASFAQDCEQVQTEVLRLHIPANSDSDLDQQIKLALRDFVLEKYSPALCGCSSLSQAQTLTEELLPTIESDCSAFLSEMGADYSAKAELTDMYFTTREYDSVILPAGTYSALRITLGSGEGHNWWCVIFPQLCLPAVSEPIATDDSVLSSFEQPQRITVKFALYEWLKGIIGE